MNPLLLRPKGDSAYQIIVKGVIMETLSMNEFHHWAEREGWEIVRQCLEQLGGSLTS